MRLSSTDLQMAFLSALAGTALDARHPSLHLTHSQLENVETEAYKQDLSA